MFRNISHDFSKIADLQKRPKEGACRSSLLNICGKSTHEGKGRKDSGRMRGNLRVPDRPIGNRRPSVCAGPSATRIAAAMAQFGWRLTERLGSAPTLVSHLRGMPVCSVRGVLTRQRFLGQQSHYTSYRAELLTARFSSASVNKHIKT